MTLQNEIAHALAFSIFSHILANNLLLTAATFITGNHYSKVVRLFKAAGVAFVKKTLFFNFQKNVVCPCLENMWSEHTDTLLKDLTEPLILCGDG